MTLHDPLCTVSDVEAYFKFKADSTSEPSKSAVEGWINIATAMIYGAIKSMYTIPITDDNDKLILKEICVAYVRDKLNYTNGANVFTVPGSNMNVPRTIKYNSFEEGIKLITNGTIQLNSTFSTFAKSKDYNSANSITAVADKETVQW